MRKVTLLLPDFLVDALEQTTQSLPGKRPGVIDNVAAKALELGLGALELDRAIDRVERMETQLERVEILIRMLLVLSGATKEELEQALAQAQEQMSRLEQVGKAGIN